MQNVATAPRPAADTAVRHLLRIPEGQTATERAAHRAFSTSVLVSATRCTLTYLVLPFLLPALGLAAGVGPAIGIPVGLVAIASNVATIRRFWAADHRWRWAYTALALTVITLLLVLLVEDISSLVGFRRRGAPARAHDVRVRRRRPRHRGHRRAWTAHHRVLRAGRRLLRPLEPAFERWVLGLPGVGPMVHDHQGAWGCPAAPRSSPLP